MQGGEALGVVDDGAGNTTLAIAAIASATLLCSTASLDETALARSVLLQCVAGEKLLLPGEFEHVAETFNRLHDVVLDSANGSARERSRAARRRRMAEDLDGAGLILVEKHFLAGLIADRISLEMTQASLGLLSEAVSGGASARGDASPDFIVLGPGVEDDGMVTVYPVAAECEAAGGHIHLDFMEGEPGATALNVND